PKRTAGSRFHARPPKVGCSRPQVPAKPRTEYIAMRHRPQSLAASGRSGWRPALGASGLDQLKPVAFGAETPSGDGSAAVHTRALPMSRSQLAWAARNPQWNPRLPPIGSCDRLPAHTPEAPCLYRGFAAEPPSALLGAAA